MNMNASRREFLTGATCAVAAGAVAGCTTALKGGVDPDFTVMISDLHVGPQDGRDRYRYTRERLSKTVSEILLMNPRPKRVVCFGDIALSYGRPEDYALSRPILQRLVDAGVELHMTMGNHDRRSGFLASWPGYANRSPVPGRLVEVVDLGHADLVLLDALRGTDDRGLSDMGPVDGRIDGEQLKWLKGWLAQAKRPFFLGSHQFRDLTVEGCATPLSLLGESRLAVGWIYGHDHTWCPDMGVASWARHSILPTLALPSTGLWGDIGYVKFKTTPAGAVAELVQDDYYFQTPTAVQPRPAAWDLRLADNQGKFTRFAF